VIGALAAIGIVGCIAGWKARCWKKLFGGGKRPGDNEDDAGKSKSTGKPKSVMDELGISSTPAAPAPNGNTGGAQDAVELSQVCVCVCECM
jgi:hypothetical protein